MSGVTAELGGTMGTPDQLQICTLWGLLSTPGTQRGDEARVSPGAGGWEVTGRAETPGEPGLGGGDGDRCLLNLDPTDEKKKKFAGSKFSWMQLALSTTPSRCCCQHPFRPGILEWEPSLLVPKRGDATAGQEWPPCSPGAAQEIVSIFIGGKPTAVQVYTATRATLRTPLHAGNHGYTRTGRRGLSLLGQWGSPALRGPPVQHSGLVWGFGTGTQGVSSVPRTWELG